MSGPSTLRRAAKTSASTRSSTWQNCHLVDAPRCLKQPGDHRVRVRADHGCRPHADDIQWIGAAGGETRESLHLDPVTDETQVRLGTNRRVVGQRDRTSRVGAVHHRACQQHDPRDIGRCCRSDDVLGSPHVDDATLDRRCVRTPVISQVDNRLDARELGSQRRVAHIGASPGDAGHVPAGGVDADDPCALARLDEPRGDATPELTSGTGDRHAAPAALSANGSARPTHAEHLDG